MATVTGLTAERMLEIEANSVKAEHVDVNKVTASIVTGAAATGTLLLGKAYRINKIVSNKPCRLRLYASAAQRTADADRPRTLDPEGDHGCIMEVFCTAELLSFLLLPIPHGYVADGNTYFSIVNDGTDGVMNFTLTTHVLED